VSKLTARRAIQYDSVAWAGVGLSVSLSAFGDVNEVARWIVLIATIAGAGSAFLAAIALGHRHYRTAGALLLISVVTPTYYGYVLNVPALLLGPALLIAPKAVLRPSSPSA